LKQKTVLTEAQKEERKQKRKEKREKKKAQMKTRRVIKLMFNNCPICSAELREVEKNMKPEQINFFAMVQFATNPDGTGYESYYCGMCQQFFMMIISPQPIMAQPNFVTGMGQPPQAGQQQDPNAPKQEPQGWTTAGNGNGNGQADQKASVNPPW
jgi:hypothetical protein